MNDGYGGMKYVHFSHNSLKTVSGGGSHLWSYGGCQHFDNLKNTINLRKLLILESLIQSLFFVLYKSSNKHELGGVK